MRSRSRLAASSAARRRIAVISRGYDRLGAESGWVPSLGGGVDASADHRGPLATGRGPRPLTDLDGLAPLVRAEDVVLAGYRVLDDNDRFGTEHVRDSGITVLDYRDLRAGTIPLILDRALATVTRPGLRGFWVHLDVDVLDDAIMPAVDYRHPGGLSWDEAAQLLQGLLGRPDARGLNVTIFNPDLDPDGSIARQLAELIARCVPAA